MKVSDAVTIYDPYEWLPGDGESKVSYKSVGADVSIEVIYDCQSNGSDSQSITFCKKYLIFKSAFYFYKAPFPGAELLNIEWKADIKDISSLVEFKYSELALQARKIWSDTAGSANIPEFRHFSIYFMSENVCFHIIASDVKLADEELV